MSLKGCDKLTGRLDALPDLARSMYPPDEQLSLSISSSAKTLLLKC